MAAKALTFALLFLLSVAYGAELVSVIVPTYNRPMAVAHTIELFQKQRYADKELIIIDDSEVSMENDTLVLESADFLTYIHLNDRASIGAKRNIALDMARGAYVCLWDDDDYYGPLRLEQQITLMGAYRMDVSLYRSSWVYFAQEGQMTYAGPNGVWTHQASTTCFVKEKATSMNARFPDTSVAEDLAFLDQLMQNGAKVHMMENSEPVQYVYVRHAGSTWRSGKEEGHKPVATPAWFLSEAAFFNQLNEVLEEGPKTTPINYIWPEGLSKTSDANFKTKMGVTYRPEAVVANADLHVQVQRQPYGEPVYFEVQLASVIQQNEMKRLPGKKPGKAKDVGVTVCMELSFLGGTAYQGNLFVTGLSAGVEYDVQLLDCVDDADIPDGKAKKGKGKKDKAKKGKGKGKEGKGFELTCDPCPGSHGTFTAGPTGAYDGVINLSGVAPGFNVAIFSTSGCDEVYAALIVPALSPVCGGDGSKSKPE